MSDFREPFADCWVELDQAKKQLQAAERVIDAARDYSNYPDSFVADRRLKQALSDYDKEAGR